MPFANHSLHQSSPHTTLGDSEFVGAHPQISALHPIARSQQPSDQDPQAWGGILTEIKSSPGWSESIPHPSRVSHSHSCLPAQTWNPCIHNGFIPYSLFLPFLILGLILPHPWRSFFLPSLLALPSLIPSFGWHKIFPEAVNLFQINPLIDPSPCTCHTHRSGDLSIIPPHWNYFSQWHLTFYSVLYLWLIHNGQWSQ